MLDTTREVISAALRGHVTLTPAERKRRMQLITAPPQEPLLPPPPAGPVERILDRKQTAQRFGKSFRFVDRLAAEGVLKKIVLPNRKRACGFREADVIRLIATAAGGVQ